MTCCFEGLEALAIAMADAKGMAQPSSRADQQPGTAAKAASARNRKRAAAKAAKLAVNGDGSSPSGQ